LPFKIVIDKRAIRHEVPRVARAHNNSLRRFVRSFALLNVIRENELHQNQKVDGTTRLNIY